MGTNNYNDIEFQLTCQRMSKVRVMDLMTRLIAVSVYLQRRYIT